jgi:hypothetical protein
VVTTVQAGQQQQLGQVVWLLLSQLGEPFVMSATATHSTRQIADTQRLKESNNIQTWKSSSRFKG